MNVVLMFYTFGEIELERLLHEIEYERLLHEFDLTKLCVVIHKKL